MKIIIVSMSLLAVFFVSDQANAAETEHPVQFCKDDLKNKPAVRDLIRLAYTNCMRFLADRSEPRRFQLRVINGNCTDKRVGSTARRAEALYRAGRDGASTDVLRKHAEKLRKNSTGRSKMYSSCWKSTVETFDSRIGGSTSFSF